MPGTPIPKKIATFQKFISSFEYNYTGETYVVLQRDRGMSRLAAIAREIITKALPIQCIEAVFLAVYLTRDMKEVGWGGGSAVCRVVLDCGCCGFAV